MVVSFKNPLIQIFSLVIYFSGILQLVAGEVVLVCTPISYLVAEVSPDDSIFIERQLDDVHLIVEVPDCLVGMIMRSRNSNRRAKPAIPVRIQSCVMMAKANTAIDAMRLR